MKIRCILIVSSMHVATLALGPPVLAQNVLAGVRGQKLERTENFPTPNSVVITFEGFVDAPDGTPAVGAVVVSSAGGQTVTDARGGFRLEAEVPVDATSVQVTAAGRAGQNLLTSQDVSLPALPSTCGSARSSSPGVPALLVGCRPSGERLG